MSLSDLDFDYDALESGPGGELYTDLIERFEDGCGNPAESTRALYNAAVGVVTRAQKAQYILQAKLAKWLDSPRPIDQMAKYERGLAATYAELADILVGDEENELQQALSGAVRGNSDVTAGLLFGLEKRKMPPYPGSETLVDADGVVMGMLAAHSDNPKVPLALVEKMETARLNYEPTNRDLIFVRSLLYYLENNKPGNDTGTAEILKGAIKALGKRDIFEKFGAIEALLAYATGQEKLKEVFIEALNLYIRSYLFYKVNEGGRRLERFRSKGQYFASHALAEVLGTSENLESRIAELVTPEGLATIITEPKAVLLLQRRRDSAEKITQNVREELLRIVT